MRCTTKKSETWGLFVWFLFVNVHVILCKPLNMEVEWCLQGGTAKFTGFFTEVLGLSSGLREVFPKLRIVKSTFLSSFDELLIPEESTLYNALFEKERENMRYLVSYNHSPIRMSETKYLKFMNQSADVDVHSACSNPQEHVIQPSDGKVFLDSSRGLAYYNKDKMTHADQCCMICAFEPLCLGWSRNQDRCHLKTRYENRMHKGTSAAVNEKLYRIKTRNFPTPRAVIFHGTMCGYQNESISNIRRDINTIYIGRYMFERDSKNLMQTLEQEEYRVLTCLLQMDEVWVPSTWMKLELTKLTNALGFGMPMVAVVPEAVDTVVFDPSAVNKSSSSAEDTFQFLSIFKWEHRKGWDVLLKAYWSTFSLDDNVELRLHTYRPSFLLKKGESNITENLMSYARTEFGEEMSQLARVRINDQDDPSYNAHSIELSREGMRRLYRNADAFVLPTRGEGWCLPAAEAMAMALPVIITNYSGPTAFANEENAYLIPANDSIDNVYIEPDVKALASLLQFVKKNPEESKEKGLQARRTMQNLSPASIASDMADRLRELAKLRGWQE